MFDAILSNKEKRKFLNKSQHELKVWDLKTGMEVSAFSGESPFLSVVFSPNGTIIAGEKSGRVHFLRFERGSENWKQN